MTYSNAVLFLVFQLCVQKLRILIEDSDQNRKFSASQVPKTVRTSFVMLISDSSEISGPAGYVENTENASEDCPIAQRLDHAMPGRQGRVHSTACSGSPLRNGETEHPVASRESIKCFYPSIRSTGLQEDAYGNC